MDAAQRILLYLDASECYPAPAPQRSRSARVRKVASALTLPATMSAGAADFGTVNGEQSVAELQDIMASWDYRMKQLAQAYADFSPAWSQRDRAAFVDWTNDWQQLQNRYQAALSRAQSAVSSARWTIALPNSAIPAQAEYDGLAKAMRQCYPPDGCPVAKGDFMDLSNRLEAAGGKTDYSQMPQPTATDVERTALAASAPLDVVAQAGGLEAPKLPGTGGIFSWVAAHKTQLLILGGVVVGGLVLLEVAPLLALPGKLAKGVAALAA